MAEPKGELPKLGGRTKDIIREGKTAKPSLELQSKAKSRASNPLKTLTKAERGLSKDAGKSDAVSRVLGSNLGARLLPALAIGMTLKRSK